VLESESSTAATARRSFTIVTLLLQRTMSTVFLFELKSGYRPFQYSTRKQQAEWGNFLSFLTVIRSHSRAHYFLKKKDDQGDDNDEPDPERSSSLKRAKQKAQKRKDHEERLKRVKQMSNRQKGKEVMTNQNQKDSSNV